MKKPMTQPVYPNNPAAAAQDRHDAEYGADGHATDGKLVEALRHGEAWAIEELHRNLTPGMIAVAMRYTRCRATADDIVQDTWLGVLKGIGNFEGRCRLQTWIFRILHYRARTSCFRAGRTIVLSELDLAPANSVLERAGLPTPGPSRASPEDHALAAELTALVTAGLAGLPAAQRAVFILHDMYGWTSEEVCRRLQLSAGNQRVLLHRARRSLRRTLNGYRYGEEPYPEIRPRGERQLTERSDV